MHWLPKDAEVRAFLVLLLFLRVVCVLWLPVSDCDETYNFIEPQHWLLYGVGLQTWEYAAQFGLRSVTFLTPYHGVALVVRWIVRCVCLSDDLCAPADEGVVVYYASRVVVAAVSALAEVSMISAMPLAFRSSISSLANHRAMVRIGCVVLCGSTAVSHASFSFLPTSLCMTLYFVIARCWMVAEHDAMGLLTPLGAASAASSNSRKAHQDQHQRGALRMTAILGGVASALVVGFVAWPFALLLAVPVALRMLRLAFLKTTAAFVIASALLLPVVLRVDGLYYCMDWMCAACNLVRYNVFGGEGRGPDLYGVEPWTYFVKNLLLQFSVLFPVALAAPLLALRATVVGLLRERRGRMAASKSSSSRTEDDLRSAMYASPFFLWFFFWLRVPHKEERFLVPSYPFLVLSATFVLYRMWTATTEPNPSSQLHRRRLPSTSFGKAAVVALLFGYAIISLGRFGALTHYYGGPQAMWTKIASENLLLPVNSDAARMQSNADPTATNVAYGSSATGNVADDADNISSAFQRISTTKMVVVCVGKEWYRFPSHYFLPHHRHHHRNEPGTEDPATCTLATYRFLRSSSFSGALPIPFPSASHVDSLCRPRIEMNDLNQPNDGQWVSNPNEECDYVWDTLVDDINDQNRQQLQGWDTSVFSVNALEGAVAEGTFRLLDVDATSSWCRALYFPWLPTHWYERCAHWKTLVLRRRPSV